MSDRRIPPLATDLEALLEAERVALPRSAAVDRIWSRLENTVASPADRERSGPSRAAGTLSSRAAATVAAALVAGGVVGAALHAAFGRPAPARIVYVERPAPSSTVVSIGSRDVSPQPEELPPAAPAQAHDIPRSPSPPTSSLSAERMLLDDARRALNAEEPTRALALLDMHAHRFARPELGEEREALAIQTLVALRRYGEARSRAARFRAATPNSLFLPAIDSSLASIP
jgi:hypothetical protein